MQKNIFSCISEKDFFIRKSNKILERRLKKYSCYNSLFVKWGTYIPYTNIRNIINVAYNRCEMYLDNKFDEILVIKNEFHPRLWELFLCDFFLTKDINLDLKKKKNEWTPDFCILDWKTKIWVEAKSLAKHDSVKDLWNWSHNLSEISNSRYLRLTSWFEEKANKWENTYINNWCKDNDPFIIAINWNLVWAWLTDKWILWPLYWIWLTQYNFWMQKVSYQKLWFLQKTLEKQIEVWYFNKPEFNHVSWVIFLQSEIQFYNNEMVVEHKDFQYIPNINAKNPISESMIKKLNLFIN